jgi:hypothetical protein
MRRVLIPLAALVSVYGCASESVRSAQPCALSDTAMSAAHANVESYLKSELGALYVYYQGTTSTFAVDEGSKCRFYVAASNLDAKGSSLAHGDMFVHVSKNTLRPTSREQVRW